MIFRCTSRVARRFGLGLDAAESAATTNVLGDWYANLFNHGSQRWVLCVSEKIILPVLVPARNNDFPASFPHQLGLVLRAIGVPPHIAAAECDRSSTWQFGKTISRSVLGSLNNMAFHAHYSLERWGDPVSAAVNLSEMPCRLKSIILPCEEAFELLGIPELYDRHRFLRTFGA